MELTLKLLTGRSAGKDIKIATNKFLIGRAEDCHLRPHSDLISRHHCAVLVEEGFCAVRDFGSKNGTYINGERVVGQQELHNGDRLKVGVLEFEVQLTSSVGGKKRPKVKDIKDAAQRMAAGPARSGCDDDISDWLAADNDAVRDTNRIDVKGLTHPPHETPAVSMSNRETTFIKTKTEETATLQHFSPAAKKRKSRKSPPSRPPPLSPLPMNLPRSAEPKRPSGCLANTGRSSRRRTPPKTVAKRHPTRSKGCFKPASRSRRGAV